MTLYKTVQGHIDWYTGVYRSMARLSIEVYRAYMGMQVCIGVSKGTQWFIEVGIIIFQSSFCLMPSK